MRVPEYKKWEEKLTGKKYTNEVLIGISIDLKAT